MDITIRYARADEFPAVAELDGASFGFHYGEQELADARLDIDPERVLVALDGTRIVGVSAEIPLPMALPGGADVPVTGITWVSVEVTHRRRGVLSAMVEHQLRELTAAGATALVLGASEGGIYGRFGFGVASQKRRTVIDRRRARLARPVDTSAVQRVPAGEAGELLPGRFEQWRMQTPGALGRDERRWQFLLLDREYQRQGRSGLFHLVHPDGYLSYRIASDWGDGNPNHVAWIVDYAPATAEAHAALWQTLLAMDLIGSVESYCLPLDDPLPWLLTDPRRVETTHVGDGLWVRPLDVERLLAARTYAVEVDVVLAVDDPVLGGARYRLRGGPDAATCTRSDLPADVHLGVAQLGAVVLGGTRLAQLARAGLVHADDQQRLERLDRALLAARAPAQGTYI